MKLDTFMLEAAWEVDDLTPDCPPIAPFPRPPKPPPPPMPPHVVQMLANGSFVLDTGEVVTEECYAFLLGNGYLP